MAWWNDALDAVGGLIGGVLVTPETFGVGTIAGAGAGVLATQELQKMLGWEGSTTPTTQPRAEMLNPGPNGGPITISSGNQGQAAEKAADGATLFTDYTNVMKELDSKQVSVSSIQAEAKAAQSRVQQLVNDINNDMNEVAELKAEDSSGRPFNAIGPALVSVLRTDINQKLNEVQTVLNQQNSLAQKEAQVCNQLAQQYAAVGKQPKQPTQTPTPTPTPTQTPTPQQTPTPTPTPTPQQTPTPTPTPTPQQTQTDPYTAEELAAEENSGSGSDLSSELSSMLPELMMSGMMPAMIAPEMASSQGANSTAAHQADSAATQGAQTMSDTTSSGTSPKPQAATASSTGGAGDGYQTQPGANAATQPASGQPVGNSGAAPAGPDTDVKLPDGTTTRAPNAQAATAVRAALNGASVADAYQQAGVSLPPSGTPVPDPVEVPDLKAGDVGVWKDHQVMALGDHKVLVPGQGVQPESSLGSSPDFLGWMRPTQPSSGQPAAPVPAAAAPAAPAAAGLSSAPAPALAGSAPSPMPPATPS